MITNDQKEIILRLEHIIDGEAGQEIGGIQPQLPSASRKSMTSMLGGLSAQILVENASRLISASGSQQLASVIREGSQWTFLGLRAMAGDPTAMLVGVTKSISMILLELQKIKEEKRQTAQKYNELLQLQLRSGQASISANTEISYDKFGRVTLRDRK
jgi:hypothetical protein